MPVMVLPAGSKAAPVLPKNDVELITYNENKHVITVTTPKGTVKQYSRNPDVEVRKDGTVKVDDISHGWEIRPFIGLGYSDTGRAYTGCQLYYFHQFDAGASFGWTADNRYNAVQPMLSLSWNFYSNSSLHVGINPVSFVTEKKPEVGVFFSVKL